MWLGAADCMIATLSSIITGGGLTFFFVNYFKMSPALSGLCWMLFGLWNAVNDPLFGYISDKTKSYEYPRQCSKTDRSIPKPPAQPTETM